MALPASAQAQKDALEKLPVNETPPIEAPKPLETPTATSVTISRDEFNELQAAADRVKAADGRAEILQGDLDVLTKRLTDLETASKGKPSADLTPAPAALPTVQYTEKENEDYGDSRDYIRKVCTELLGEVLPGVLKEFDTKLEGVQSVATKASQNSDRLVQKSFTDKVKDRVPEFEACVDHKHWHAFTQSMEPVSGLTYGECIQNNLDRENLTGMVNVFDTFKKKYAVGAKPNDDAYAGALPSGNTPPPNNGNEGKEILKFSDRKELNKKMMQQKISPAEYEVEKAKYTLAEKEGRLNYDV